MTSEFDCFGPGFFAWFLKVGLPKKTYPGVRTLDFSLLVPICSDIFSSCGTWLLCTGVPGFQKRVLSLLIDIRNQVRDVGIAHDPTSPLAVEQLGSLHHVNDYEHELIWMHRSSRNWFDFTCYF